MTNEAQLQVPLDGLFLSPTPPWGASVLVLRQRGDAQEVLLLRRRGVWSPPAVTRLPDEPAVSCASRALLEIAGIVLPVWPIADADPQWTVFLASARDELLVRPGNGYDAFEWVDLAEAQQRCTDLVSQSLQQVA
jgi:hypothetical protein